MSESVRIEMGTRASRIGGLVLLATVVVLAGAPWWGSAATLNLLTQVYAYLALATLWNLLAGFSGLVSVGQQAYVGMGGYGLFALTIFAGVHPLVAVLIAGVGAALISIPVAALLFRLRGAYFAIGSWVVAEVFRLLASGTSLPVRVVTGMAASRADRERLLYWAALVLAVAIVALVVVFLRSRYGLALRAIHNNEVAARSNGVEVTRTRLAVYVLAAFGTAMVGALIFLQKLRISPDAAFSVNDWTAFVIFITVIGGVGRIEGPIVGTILFFILRQTLADLGSMYLLMLGLVAIVVMLRAPRGVWGFIVDRFHLDLVPLARRVIPPRSQETAP